MVLAKKVFISSDSANVLLSCPNTCLSNICSMNMCSFFDCSKNAISYKVKTSHTMLSELLISWILIVKIHGGLYLSLPNLMFKHIHYITMRKNFYMIKTSYIHSAYRMQITWKYLRSRESKNCVTTSAFFCWWYTFCVKE